MKIQPVKTTPVSLHHLNQIELNPASRARFEEALSASSGDPTWRARKSAEARELLALVQVAPQRIRLLEIDLKSNFRAIIALNVPVACWTGAEQDVAIASGALLALDYPREAISVPTPGYAFFTILEPRNVWHANVRLPDQPLCLGPKLPAGIRVLSLIQMAYGALSLQTIQIDPADSAGVLNVDAADFWQRNLQRVPLSKEPFLPAIKAL